MYRSRAAVVMVALLVLAACSSTHHHAPAPTLTEAWRNAEISPIGQPVAAGDTLVVYGTVGTDLYLYGVSAADGTIRWRQAASPSATLAGTALTPEVIDGRVAYFRPDPKGNLSARLVVAAPDSGNDVLVSDPLVFRSHPTSCSDGKDICLTAEDGGTAGTTSRRFAVEAHGPVHDTGAAPPDSRVVGDELLDLGSRRPETLAGFRDGTIRWRAPLSRYFGPGYTTDLGWDFGLFRSAGIHVGSVGHPADQSDSKVVIRDLTKVQTAAFDAATGALRWQADGTSYLCAASIQLRRMRPDGRSEDWPVRCRYRGSARYDRASNTASYEALQVTIEGFDVNTGDTTWSLPLGPAAAFMKEGTKTTAVSDSEVMVQGPTGPVIVDLGSGATRRPPKGEAVWCASGVFFEYRESKRLPDGTSGNDWRGGTRLYACTADGSPTTATPSYIGPSLGATVGERAIVAMDHRLVAYERPGR